MNRAIDTQEFGRLELKTLPLPCEAKGLFATYLCNGQVMIMYKLEGDPETRDFTRIATLEDDGSNFREIFAGEIKVVKSSNGMRLMPLRDNKRVLMGDYMLECEPDIRECASVKIVPIVYPWGIVNRDDIWCHWSEIIASPDGAHICWTMLYKRMSCDVIVGRLKRGENEYIIEKTQVISSMQNFVPDPANEGCVRPVPMRGGEVKQFVYGGTAISQVGAGEMSALPESTVQKLDSDECVQITRQPGYEETTMFSPDEKLGLVMSTRASKRTNLAILGLLPRPFASHVLSMIYNNIYMYCIAGSRFFRKGNVGPVLIDIEKSMKQDGYMGATLNDPDEEWVYHSPMSWHPHGNRAMWMERKRTGGEPRARIVILKDRPPQPDVPAKDTPDDIPYAVESPELLANNGLRGGRIIGRHSGECEIKSEWRSEGGLSGESRIEFSDFSDDGSGCYTGFESVSQSANGEVRYVANLVLAGERAGKMDMKLVFRSGSYARPPRICFDPDETGAPASRGYAEYNGQRIDMSEYSE